MRRRWIWAAASLCLVLPAAAQPALDNFDAVKTSGEITNMLAARP
jgi:hypothetical protein